MNVGLFFGSFNPIHIGHVAIANYMVEFTDIQELWFVITPHNPVKKKSSLLDNYQRLHMVELAIESYTAMRTSTVEFSLPQPSYTVHTLAHLHQKFPTYTFSLIMGADNLENFHTWKNYEYILETCKILVYKRPFYTIPETYQNHASITIVDAPLMEISSSFIRKSIADNKNIAAFLPFKVWDYIEQMNFYKH